MRIISRRLRIDRRNIRYLLAYRVVYSKKNSSVRWFRRHKRYHRQRGAARCPAPVLGVASLCLSDSAVVSARQYQEVVSADLQKSEFCHLRRRRAGNHRVENL